MRIRVVWLADRVGRISSRAGAGESPQLADDSGAVHRPSGTRVECAGRHAVLAIRPPHAVSIHGRPVCRVRPEDVGEAEAIGLLNVPVARQRQDSRCPAAVTAVVPESGLTTSAGPRGSPVSPAASAAAFSRRAASSVKASRSGPGAGRLVSRTSGCSRATGSASSPAAECQVNLTLPPVAGHRWLWRGWRCR